MAEHDRQYFQQTELDSIIDETRRRSNGTIGVREAIAMIIGKLDVSNGYYVWAPLGDDDGGKTWLLRLPRTDLPEEAWLKEESAEVVHICRPVKYLEGVEKRDKEASANHTGYVREGTCTKCRKDIPDAYDKKGTMIVKLHKLGKKAR